MAPGRSPGGRRTSTWPKTAAAILARLAKSKTARSLAAYRLYLAGHSFDTIADALGVSFENVADLIRRGHWLHDPRRKPKRHVGKARMDAGPGQTEEERTRAAVIARLVAGVADHAAKRADREAEQKGGA